MLETLQYLISNYKAQSEGQNSKAEKRQHVSRLDGTHLQSQNLKGGGTERSGVKVIPCCTPGPQQQTKHSLA